MLRPRLCCSLLIGLLCWFSSTEYANARFLTGPTNPSLTNQRGQGHVGLIYDFSKSGDFFDASGNRQDTSSGLFPGGPQRFVDHRAQLFANYGITDTLTLAIELPLVYRFEQEVLDGEDVGLGDIRLWLLYRLFRWQRLALEGGLRIEAKFPSGESGIGLLNSSASASRELPLGSGQTDLLLALQFSKALGPLQFKKELGFRLRLAAQVDYLQAFQIGIDPTLGLINQAVGNLSVDYGEEFLLNLLATWPFLKRYQLGVETALLYFLSGEFDSFTIDFTSISKSKASLPEGYLWTISPFVGFNLFKDFELRCSVEIPLLGEDVPVIALVDSLVGLHYIFGVTYAY